MINDTSKFKKLPGDDTLKREGSLQRFLNKIHKLGFLNNQTYDDIYPRGSLPARLYGLPKMHKVQKEGDRPPFRPIVSFIGSCNYKLAKHLGKMLSPHINQKFSCSDTFSFIDKIQNVNIDRNKFLVSYDIQSLFTNIPLNETIDLAVNLLIEKERDLKISRADLKKLFQYATSMTHFLFDGEYYEQIDGVAMGSPLAPILANLFLGCHEEIWIDSFNGQKPLFYSRYVDDILAIFENKTQANDFLSHLNSRHPNIKFTIEYENESKISFLDVLLDKSNDNLITSVYRKATFSGVLTNFQSFTPLGYKLGLVNCLIDRVYKINNSPIMLKKNLNNVFDFLKRNLYPQTVLDKINKNYLKKRSNALSVTNNNCDDSETKTIYFKLPYLGKKSIHFKARLQKLCEKFKISSKIKLAFTSFKLCNWLNTKDKHSLNSHIVYKFQCGFCKESYVGYTTRHYKTRINEHLSSDKSSHIYKHLNNNNECKNNSEAANFIIIDRACTDYQLRIKEALHIQWLKPAINQQKKSCKLTLIL